jgi:putative glycosyltransferase (TIGR04372 family)
LTEVFGSKISGAIADLLLPVLKTVRPLYCNANLYYETGIAPFIAKYMPFLLWPAYKFFSAMNIRFVVNVSDGTGHITPELDNFFRKYHLGEIDRKKKYVFVRKESIFSPACVRLYRHKFWWAVCNDFIYHLTLPVTIRFKDILLDSGISRGKWQLDANGNYKAHGDGQTFLHLIDKKTALGVCEEWFRRRRETADYYPLREADFDFSEINSLVGTDLSKLALVHIKSEVMNATAQAIDPETYLESLAYLKECGYKLVFAGREKMPESFKKFGMINYSESPVASFKNDLALFKAAQITMTGAGGIGYLAACMDTPNLYLNSWHIKSAGLSRRSVCIPALIKRKSEQEFVKYPEQNLLYIGTKDQEGPEVFPQEIFQARNASSDEILEGIKELVTRVKNNDFEWTPIQKRFSALLNSDMRISDHFLKKWEKLFA